jgi:hypothetical protein
MTSLRKLIRRREKTYQAAQGSSDPKAAKAAKRAERALRKKMGELWPKRSPQA